MDAPRKSCEFTFSARARLSCEDYACTAFTLIELLVVVAVMVLMTTLAIPAFNAIRGGTDFSSEVYEVAGTLDQARAYAVANNTYVLAGIAEVSAGQDSSASSQVSGTGRVAMAVIASKTGSRPYQSLFPNSLATWSTSVYNTGIATSNGGGFVAVTKLLVLPNLHLVDLQYNGASQLSLPTSGNMARPTLGANGYYYDLSNPNTPSPSQPTQFNTQFAWPLGTKLNGNPNPQYTFVKVVEFDPQGSARVISSGNTSSFPDAIPQYIEIGLQPAHGATAAGPPSDQASNAGQIGAIQINGISGTTHTYRP